MSRRRIYARQGQTQYGIGANKSGDCILDKVVEFKIPVAGVNSLDQAVEQARHQVRQFAANLVRAAEQKFF